MQDRNAANENAQAIGGWPGFWPATKSALAAAIRLYLLFFLALFFYAGFVNPGFSGWDGFALGSAINPGQILTAILSWILGNGGRILFPILFSAILLKFFVKTEALKSSAAALRFPRGMLKLALGAGWIALGLTFLLFLHAFAALSCALAPVESARAGAVILILWAVLCRKSLKRRLLGESPYWQAVRFFLAVVLFCIIGVCAKYKAALDLEFPGGGAVSQIMPGFNAYYSMYAGRPGRLTAVGRIEEGPSEDLLNNTPGDVLRQMGQANWASPILYHVDDESGKVLNATRLPDGTRPLRGAFDERRGLLFFSNYRNRPKGGANGTLVVDAKTGRTLESLPAMGCNGVVGMRIDRAHGELHALCETPGALYRYDLESLELLSKGAQLDGLFFYDILTLRDRLYMTDPVGGQICIGDRQAGPDGETAIKWRCEHSESHVLDVVFDEEADRAYAATPIRRSVSIYRLSDFRLLRRLPANGLPRSLAFDKERRWLFAASYLSGVVELFDADLGRKLAQWQVGSRPRNLNWNPKTANLYASTAVGLFKIEVRNIEEK